MNSVISYNPDVLNCLANLSNDEVFTSPAMANAVLDMLPQELFRDPNTTFLDPAAKSGVFLREIAKRLLVGLEDMFPDLQERVDHIFQKQLFGIAITEITSLLARRSVYCSKTANGNYSVCRFGDVQGNIRFKRTRHQWKNGKCTFCGASEKLYGEKVRGIDLESHAYEFIHTLFPERIYDMKFDVIISNPPYQLNDGGNNASASPIYQDFVIKALKMAPRYVTMIIPARWYSGGKGLDEFRNLMLSDRRIRYLADFFDSQECFPGIDLSGGICYFLWDRDHEGDCLVETHRETKVSQMTRPLLENGCESFIRFNEAVSVLRKVSEWDESSFSDLISSRKPFGLETNVPISRTRSGPGMVKVFAYPANGFIHREKIQTHCDWIDQPKVCISYAYGERGEFPYQVIGKPFLSKAGSCCTETYLVAAVCKDTATAENVISYMTTKFFRFLVLLKKNTQHATKTVYSLVPLQDFSRPWSDEELYAKYGLTDEEISFIESMIKPMELGGDDHA